MTCFFFLEVYIETTMRVRTTSSSNAWDWSVTFACNEAISTFNRQVHHALQERLYTASNSLNFSADDGLITFQSCWTGSTPPFWSSNLSGIPVSQATTDFAQGEVLFSPPINPYALFMPLMPIPLSHTPPPVVVGYRCTLRFKYGTTLTKSFIKSV